MHLKGLWMTVAAVLILSPDALLVKLIACDIWTLLFWRCLLTAAMQGVFLAVFFRRQLFQGFRAIGRPGLLSCAIVVIGSLFFVHSLKQTAAANTLVILAATPLVSSLLSWLVLREPPARRTWIAITICFAAILVIFSGSLKRGLLLGDLLALGATVMWAANLIVLRAAKSSNMIPANLLGNLLIAPLALGAGANPLSVSATDMTYLLVLGGVVLPVSFTLITLSPRYLPAPEISLILLIETVVGPLWVWLLVGEAPAVPTLVAGVVIVATLVVHTLVALRALRPPRIPPEAAD